MQRNRRSKFGNTRTPYGGRVFHSKKEADHAARLDMLKRAKDPKEQVAAVEYQVPFRLDVNGVHIANYIADFVVRYADGRTEVQDVKGFRTDVYKLKKTLMRAVHGIEIVEI